MRPSAGTALSFADNVARLNGSSAAARKRSFPPKSKPVRARELSKASMLGNGRGRRRMTSAPFDRGRLRVSRGPLVQQYLPSFALFDRHLMGRPEPASRGDAGARADETWGSGWTSSTPFELPRIDETCTIVPAPWIANRHRSHLAPVRAESPNWSSLSSTQVSCTRRRIPCWPRVRMRASAAAQPLAPFFTVPLAEKRELPELGDP